MKIKQLAGLIIALLAMVACDETTENIGISLTDNMDHLEVAADTFTVTSRSIVANAVLSRSTTGYLGCVKDPETGAYVTGHFMTQFHTSEDYSLPDESWVVSQIDGRAVADSCEIRLFYQTFYGDTLATMKLTAYELDKPMEENVSYYTDFDPLAEGLVRPDGIQKNKVYSLVDLAENETDRNNKNYVDNINIRLNDTYTDKNGNTYNNFGTYIMRQCYDHPEYFKDSYSLSHNILPGFYFKTTSGVGAMANITITNLNVFFHYNMNDSVYSGLLTLSGTEEVLQKTTISNDGEAVRKLAEDNTCTYLKSPAGIFTELTLPVEEIMRNHENDTLNTAKITLPRINNRSFDDFSFSCPTRLLMIEADSLKSFFENNKVVNYKNSFLSSYSSNSYLVNNAYVFSNISGMITHMTARREAGLKSNANWLAEHPNWNKVVVVPVVVTTATFNSQTMVTNITHDMSLSSTRLIGGSENPYSPITLSVIYSKFK